MNAETKIALLRSMLKIRLTEEQIAERYSEWKMRCPVHLSIGQEAVAAATGLALRDDDFAISTHRAHAHFIGKGGNLPAMIAEIYGKETGCSKGKGGSMHLVDNAVGFKGSTAIVGGTIPVGVGLGLSIQLHKSDQISCVFLGDGAVEEGVFFESANFAVLKQLPVLFVCENNLYSVYSGLEVRQPAGRNIHEMVSALGLSTASGDGNDVEGVYSSVKNAAENIRKGDGPQFLEFATYRWREHCGPNYDNDIGYRSEKEFEQWKARDPLALYQAEIALKDTDFDKIVADVTREIDEAFEFAEASDFPRPEAINEHEYSEN